jgi:nucleotide-binding universal stress UspA family protein
MFRQIMIPLDGSATAEGAIRHAERLVSASSVQAEQRGSALHLVRVVAPVFRLYAWGIGTFAVSRENDEAATLVAASYLDSLRRRAGATGVRVCTSLLTGSLVPDLLQYERRQGIDLVVLARHEQAGPGQLSRGSMLQPLLRRGPAPLLVVPPALDPACLQHALLPLDGSAGAEQALNLLGHLAPKLVREVTLLQVVGTQDEEFSAFRYLSRLRQRPELAQVRSRLRVEYGDPPQRIVDLGRGRLVVLTKQRHWLPSRWLSESIAHRVLRDGAAALLIARRGALTVRDDGSAVRSNSAPRQTSTACFSARHMHVP